MELDSRKSKILSAIIHSYVSTGVPVGSKALADNLDFSVSSATVRNEMAELYKLGFLEQPYTSAGRIPTIKGYRYFIDKLMKAKQPPQNEKSHIFDLLRAAADDPEHIIKEASAILSALMPVASVITTPPGDELTIQRIKMVQTGRQSAMAVLITSGGMVKNRLFRCDFDLNADILGVFEAALNKSLKGVKLTSFNPAFIQNLAVSFGELALLMPNVLIAVNEAAAAAAATNICMSGQTNLLLMPDFDLISVRNILSFLSRPKDVSAFLLKCGDKLTTVIGDEISIYELKKTAVITSRYCIAGTPAGAVAVIGPVRMDYGAATGYVEYISSVVGTLINGLLDYSP